MLLGRKSSLSLKMPNKGLKMPKILVVSEPNSDLCKHAIARFSSLYASRLATSFGRAFD
jgi:hypothetical protein